MNETSWRTMALKYICHVLFFFFFKNPDERLEKASKARFF